MLCVSVLITHESARARAPTLPRVERNISHPMRAQIVIAGATDARAPEAPQLVKSPTIMKHQSLFGTCALEQITFQSPGKNVPDITTAPRITLHRYLAIERRHIINRLPLSQPVLGHFARARAPGPGLLEGHGVGVVAVRGGHDCRGPHFLWLVARCPFVPEVVHESSELVTRARRRRAGAVRVGAGAVRVGQSELGPQQDPDRNFSSRSANGGTSLASSSVMALKSAAQTLVARSAASRKSSSHSSIGGASVSIVASSGESRCGVIRSQPLPPGLQPTVFQ